MKPLLDALGPNHYDNLQTIAQARDILGRAKAPTNTEFSTAQSLKKMDTPGGYTPKTFAFYQTKAAAVGLANRMNKMSNKEYESIMKSAIYNPSLARQLAKE